MMDTHKVKVNIDGQEVAVEQGTMLIEAAESIGVHIPRFCYHKKLSIAANCRMCLVDVEKSGKPLPACATPVTDGMVVHTESPRAIDAQRSVMEFLLVNHPLDCPVCDQGGECELQDVSMGFGPDTSRFDLGKRAVADEDLGSLIASDMTRCILCTRCVRFGAEVAGYRELGVTGRGEYAEVGTYIKENLHSEVSGNVIDLCPVGALTSKPFRFRARAWELEQRPSIAPHDCLGSNIYLHTHRNEQVMRVVPKENESVNETWISDRDRFSYTAIHSEDRLQKPMIKKSGTFQEVEWQEALEFTANKLKQADMASTAGLISPNATTEELFLFQKVLRALGTNSVDHQLRLMDTSYQAHAPLFPNLGVSIKDLSHLDAVFLVGSYIRHEQPIASLRIRHAVSDGAKVMVLNSEDYDFNFAVSEKMIVPPTDLVDRLRGVAAALLLDNAVDKEWKDFLNVTPTETEKNIAVQLKQANNGAIIFGTQAINHPHAGTLVGLGKLICQLANVAGGAMSDGANSTGAWMAGAVPHRQAAGESVSQPGLFVAEMFEQPQQNYVLFNVEPELDCREGDTVLQALKAAQFVAVFSPFVSDVMKDYADVILPIGTFAETSGTFVNIDVQWQSFAGALPPVGDARPGWKVLRVLGNVLGLEGFEYESSEEIRDELKALVERAKEPAELVFIKPTATVGEIKTWGIYEVDNLTRRADVLQKSKLC